MPRSCSGRGGLCGRLYFNGQTNEDSLFSIVSKCTVAIYYGLIGRIYLMALRIHGLVCVYSI